MVSRIVVGNEFSGGCGVTDLNLLCHLQKYEDEI